MQLANAQAENFWRLIGVHCSTRHSIAPWRVQEHVAALVGDGQVAGSAARLQPGQDVSTWTVQVATDDGRLVMLSIEFEHERYDFDEEQRPLRRQQPVKATVMQAWTRRLGDASAFEMTKVRSAVNAFNQPVQDQIDVGGIVLTFRDGATVELVADQTEIYDHDEKGRVDTFLAAVREGAGL